MRKIVLAALVILIGIATLVWFLNRPDNRPLLTANPTPTLLAKSTLIADQVEVDKLNRGGSSYSDSKGVYSVLYPNDYTIDDMNGGEIVRIYKQGPTQTGQTEMYDGVIMNFQIVELRGQSFEEWVDTQISQSTEDGVSELVSPKKRVDINNYPGFTYTIRGLGEAVNYAVQKDPNSPYAVSITTLVADPGNVGFEEEVNAALSTLQLLK